MNKVFRLVCMAAGAAGSAFAAVTDCPVPGAGAESMTGAVTDFPMLPAICRAPDYASSLGPIRLFDDKGRELGAQPAVVEQAPASLVVDDQAARKAGVLPVAAENHPEPVSGQFNDRQMRRIGELDAMTGRPVNMNNANNLDYLRGYMQGQQARQRGQTQGGGMGGGW